MTKLNSNNSSGSIVDGTSTNEELSNGATTIGDTNASISNGLNGGLRKGPWTAAEDVILIDHVRRMGEGNWNAVQRSTGLLRCGKSCRLRWANHLRPNLKKGPFSSDEEIIILRLHARLGNKWARISTHLPGRTDNEIKNYWNTRLKRRQRAGLPIYPPEIEREFRKYNQNIAPYLDNRNPNLNTQSLLMHPSPLNFPTQHSNGMGQNPLMNQNFQNYQQFPNQMQNEMPMRQYGPKLGHNQGQFRQQQMSYGLTNFGTNSSNMMPNSFPTVKTEISSNQLYPDQASVPRPGTNNMNGTMFDAQQGGNFQNMHKIQVLPSMPQLVRGDSNSNWVNGNCVNMGGSNGNMNRQGDGNGLHGKWAGPDCMNGGANNMGMKTEFNEADIIGTMDELSNLINDATNTNVAQWLNGDVSSSNGAETSVVGGGGGSMITDDGIAMGIHQHFVPPLAH